MRHENAFSERLRDGGVALGARASTFSPALVEIYGSIGLDFVWLDFEHGAASPWNGFRLENLTRAAELAGVSLLVRVPNDPHLARKVLDAGVRNILIPRVDTAEEVSRAVRASRFVHDGSPGERGYAGGRSSAYGTADEYVEREDESVSVGVMIETEAAVRNRTEILSVPDLGFAFIGPADLSVQLGRPNERDDPAVADAIATVETACDNANVPLGGIAHDPERVSELVDRGYRAIRLGGEFEATRQLLGDRLARTESLLGGSRDGGR